jgi:hypothetical protein
VRKWNDIIKATDWTATFQATSAEQQIQSSTNTAPIVLTVNQHQYSNGDKVRVYGHSSNKAANGNWTVANVAPNTFELTGSTGSGAGNNVGNVASVIDATGATLTIKLNDKPVAGTAVFTLTPTWIDQTLCEFSISLTDVQTAALTNKALYLRIYMRDTAGKDSNIVSETLNIITL